MEETNDFPINSVSKQFVEAFLNLVSDKNAFDYLVKQIKLSGLTFEDKQDNIQFTIQNLAELEKFVKDLEGVKIKQKSDSLASV